MRRLDLETAKAWAKSEATMYRSNFVVLRNVVESYDGKNYTVASEFQCMELAKDEFIRRGYIPAFMFDADGDETEYGDNMEIVNA
jgi:hypothetical protein